MWNCAQCREEVEDNFEICWNCGTSREGMRDPSFQQAEPVEPRKVPPPLEKPVIRMAAPFACPRCQSKKMVPDVWVVDRGDGNASLALTLRLDRDPAAWFDKGTAMSELRANICGACGFTEFFATNPGVIWDAFQDRMK